MNSFVQKTIYLCIKYLIFSWQLFKVHKEVNLNDNKNFCKHFLKFCFIKYENNNKNFKKFYLYY